MLCFNSCLFYTLKYPYQFSVIFFLRNLTYIKNNVKFFIIPRYFFRALNFAWIFLTIEFLRNIFLFFWDVVFFSSIFWQFFFFLSTYWNFSHFFSKNFSIFIYVLLNYVFSLKSRFYLYTFFIKEKYFNTIICIHHWFILSY